MDILFTILAFLVAISLLIAVHEFGHFWVAQRLGVKVLRYSIGFGKPLWMRRGGADQTEYVIAAIPLGGYVKMLDEREGEVSEAEKPRAFNRQPVARRIAIVFAGPAFNFLFAIVAYWLMFVVGMTSLKPIIGEVKADSPAAIAGLAPGMQILSINGQETPILPVMNEALIPALINHGKIRAKVETGDGRIRVIEIDLQGLEYDLGTLDVFRILGFTPWRPALPAVVGVVVPDSPAQQAGFQSGDHLLAIENTQVNTWEDVVAYVKANPDQLLAIRVLRGGRELDLQVTPAAHREAGKTVGRIGLGAKVPEKIPQEMMGTYSYPLLSGFSKALEQTWQKTVLNLQLFGKLLSGEISARNLSGPIGIAQYAGLSASAGFAWFMGFLALISIGLGIINLLPVPVLDGGHLLYYFIEIIKGSPVSERTEAVGQQIGIVILIMLMGLAFYNDLQRLFG